VRYVLHLWCSEDDTPETEVFESPNSDDDPNLGCLTDQVLFFVLDFLEDAKKTDPRGFYRPIRRKPTVTGDEFWVLRDGFFKLRHIFRDSVQELYDVNMSRRVKPCART
jgi:hypothetical protein